MRIIYCPPEVANIPYSSVESVDWWWDTMSQGDSDSDMPSAGPSNNFSTSTNANATSLVQNTDLADLITKNTVNNYCRITGLKYFCGDGEHPQYPNKTCTRSVRQWIHDIDSPTVLNWTNQGRIELAKEYSLDFANEYLFSAVKKSMAMTGRLLKNAF